MASLISLLVFEVSPPKHMLYSVKFLFTSRLTNDDDDDDDAHYYFYFFFEKGDVSTIFGFAKGAGR